MINLHVIMLQMKRNSLYSLLFIILLAHTSSYAFMSGVNPDKDGGAELSIIKGIILQGPPNISVNAAYGVLKNITDEDITLIRLTSPVFDSVQLHDMEYSDDGKAKMVHITRPLIPANGELKLAPGGKHLMMLNRRRDLKVGEIIKMMVESNKERRYMLDLKVIDPRHEYGQKSDSEHNEVHSH